MNGETAALERASKEWRLTFDAIDWLLVTVDGSCLVRRLNQAALNLLGGSFQDWVDHPFADLCRLEPWASSQPIVNEVLASGRRGSVQVSDPATRHTWDVSCSAYIQPGVGQTAIVAACDVSRMAELQESLRRSETMAAMGSLLAGVAHEVRNPLFGISSLLDAWVMRGEKANLEDYQAALRREVDRLRNLMIELLEYGRPYTEKLGLGDLAAVIAGAADSCRPLAEQRRVAVHLDVFPARLRMDSSRLARVFVNLIENAVQHSEPGQEVRVQARDVSGAKGRGIEVAVRDSGPGFAPEDRRRLFAPFFTRRSGGTGLGLAIVQRIVEEHRGVVEAANADGGGAMIRVWLPLVEDRPGDVPANERVASTC